MSDLEAVYCSGTGLTPGGDGELVGNVGACRECARVIGLTGRGKVWRHGLGAGVEPDDGVTAADLVDPIVMVAQLAKAKRSAKVTAKRVRRQRDAAQAKLDQAMLDMLELGVPGRQTAELVGLSEAGVRARAEQLRADR